MKFHEPIWKGISQDAVELKTRMTSFNFFDEGNDESTIIEQTENEILKQIFENKEYLKLILNEAEIKSYSHIFTNISTHHIFGEGGGDFDLILYSKNYPYNITCIEFKRVKIIANDSDSDKINKLSGVDTLFNQLSDRIKMGFHRVFGVIIIHSDLRNRKTTNTIFRSTSKDTSTKILYKINNTKSFPNQAGLLLARFEQPTGKKYSLNFKVGLVKSANLNTQNENLRQRFNNFLNAINPK
ncbi:hypothetical protein [Leptospira meyeri]|uniref:hypothetical protein n=1 Tax=Leptospira meyeri TaxID=29508 RepID=UPI0002BD3F2E|nr:hypothetical protein [Leptospira meyeri]EMJ87279.1 hypothetical protein LEP1GSC196_2953 [Leptospira meyeri serovar Semaranga str. Veldrot Semarang 173]